MRNEVFVALAAVLLFGSARAVPTAAKPDVPAVPKAESEKPAAAPTAGKPVEDEKKVATEEELQAEIAKMEHLSPKTGELEESEHQKEEEELAHAAPAHESKEEGDSSVDVEKLRKSVFASDTFQKKVEASCSGKRDRNDCVRMAGDALFCQLVHRSKPELVEEACSDVREAPSLVQITSRLRHTRRGPEDELAKEMTHDLEMNFNKIAPFGKEDTAKELQDHAAKTQDTLVDAVENAEVAEIKRAVFRALTRLRAATIKEFDTIARLETQAIDAYNDAHHYRAENPLAHLHEDEAPVETDKLKSFH
jgi:hypothetical protein